jgi:hypothetical protein
MSEWIEHTGDACPVPADAQVEVRSRNYVNRVGLADIFDWHTGDITRYRLALEADIQADIAREAKPPA